jgi:diguanylate cyclase (GGDEF)-like protein/PAS domain S-box-containing protein
MHTGAHAMSNRILIVSADPYDITALNIGLCKALYETFEIESVFSLDKAIQRLSQGNIDAVLVNLSLPDSEGISTFDHLFAVAVDIPILTLCADGDDVTAIEALQRGSQGYLTHGVLDSNLVAQSLRNIIQRKVVEQKLNLEKDRAEITLNSISDAVIGTDMLGNVDYLNLAAEKITGWSKLEAIGNPIWEVMPLINGLTRKPMVNPILLAIQNNKPMNMLDGTILIKPNGMELAITDSAAPIRDRKGRISGAVIVFHDITASQAMALNMAHLAQHDFLTNLPNRSLLNDRITQAILLSKRRNTKLAILFLDLDNFKHINDSLGHETGDKLLQSVAKTLSGCIRHSDTLSRQGGDEFIILVMQDYSGEDAILTADKILSELAVAYHINNHELHITTSIGISVYPDDGNSAETLIKNADTAMYEAKSKGRNNYQFFRDEMNVRAVQRQLIETSLRHALEHNEFILHYQPKFNLESGQITGAEALIRWQHPDWGMVVPERFIAVAEDSGQIRAIGRWALREACTQFRIWEVAGLHPGSIAINVSPLEFHSKSFVQDVHQILVETGINPGDLQLEITESALIPNAITAGGILNQLKSIGVKLAVDDFGTGYSSLSYLNQFPIDVLKIDKSFVQDIGSRKGNGAIVNAVIAMGKSLGLKVIAEGIEEQAQLDHLLLHHCEEGQGYFFSRPLAKKRFSDLLLKGLPDMPQSCSSASCPMY